MKSTLKLMRRLLSLRNGNAKFFWMEKSKNSCKGARISRVLCALPREPLAGRINADGLINGSQALPVEQLPAEYRGFFSGTPGMMSRRIARLVPPNRFVSVIKGTNG